MISHSSIGRNFYLSSLCPVEDLVQLSKFYILFQYKNNTAHNTKITLNNHTYS
ncbi:hypothetical protein VCRA217O17_30164 [Vibrio crassostreae]|nr:hypothetical protein VCRA2113O351_40031 [Vibrio crassostreae]CAK2721335.1 hypothetical protein VCRA2119O146_10249 [Vibrio crassostreae]CAK3880660.1 hypothetical protein VCRA217O17_30164 [Vibrio crassostreae]